jgi:hypothetical protein
MYDKKQKTFKVVNPNRKEETVADVQKFPFKSFPERGISKETCERFGVRAGLSEKDGKTIEAFYFPSFNQKGKIVGYKKQDITVDKSHDYHWTTVGSVSIGNKLFGQNTVEEMNRKRANLILTEGEWDSLSVYQSCVDSVKGTKYEGIEPTVVSIPMGTKNAVEAILHNEQFVKSYDAATLFFDDDHCTPAELKKGIMKGHEAREAEVFTLAGTPETIHQVYLEKTLLFNKPWYSIFEGVIGKTLFILTLALVVSIGCVLFVLFKRRA